MYKFDVIKYPFEINIQQKYNLIKITIVKNDTYSLMNSTKVLNYIIVKLIIKKTSLNNIQNKGNVKYYSYITFNSIKTFFNLHLHLFLFLSILVQFDRLND